MNLMNMSNNFFNVLRGGIHTTFQDNGIVNKQHLGITVGGAVDKTLYKLSNEILNNHPGLAVLEFCFQGPKLKLLGSRTRLVITGNVFFKITNSKETFQGISNKSYILKKGDIIDIISTVKSNYGYLSVEGGFKIKKEFGSFSTLTTSIIGANNGYKIKENQKLFYNLIGKKIYSHINFTNDELTKYIRVIAGPQMNHFFPKEVKKFFKNPFFISNTLNRMGIRLMGNSCKAIKSHDIPSEGIISGSIQVPGDGHPIVLMNDHPTIGGYPKIAIVILADIEKIAQFPAETSVYFKLISLREAELIYKKSIADFNKKISNIKHS